MALDYRPLSADDERFDRYVRYAFRPQAGPHTEDDEERPDLSDLLARRGLFDGDDLVAVCGYFDFSARIRGEFRRLGGVSAVATPPEYRRRGYVAHLLRELVGEFREEGIHFSALWPFERAFYRRYGWATCNAYRVYTAPPEQVRTAAAAPAGAFRRVEADDWRDLAAVHRTHGTDRALFVDRTEAWWRERVFRGWETDPYVYVWERDGDPRGYVAYVIEEDDDDRRLNVRELVYRDDEAYRQLLRFLGNHDSQVASVRTYGPPETDLLDRVAAPDEVDCEIQAGPMARVEDVAAGLSALDYPDVSVDVTFRVDDPLADDRPEDDRPEADPLTGENGGTYALAVEDGTGECRPTDAEPAVELDVGTLAQLCVGYRRARELATLGDLTGAESAVAALDRAFPPEDAFLREGF